MSKNTSEIETAFGPRYISQLAVYMSFFSITVTSAFADIPIKHTLQFAFDEELIEIDHAKEFLKHLARNLTINPSQFLLDEDQFQGVPLVRRTPELSLEVLLEQWR